MTTPLPSDDAYRPEGLEAWAPAISAVIAIGAVCLFVVGGRDFCLDDAWIHLSYAKSLSLGDGLSYNPGDHETGFSSPLWVALLAAWPMGADPVVSVKMLGALLHGVTAWLACALTLQLAQATASLASPKPLASIGLLAGALVALQPAALQGAVSGMEVPLGAALMMGLGLACARGAWGPAALVAGLGVLARPEMLGFAVALGVGCSLWIQRAAWRVAAGAAVAMLAWVVYCSAVSGWPLPNTFYVKTATHANADAWAFVLSRVLTPEPWIVGVGGLLSAGAALRGELRSGRRFAAIWIGAWLATFVAIAWSRPLNPAVTFYESRYFSLFGAAPLVVVALGAAHLPRWTALACMATVFGVGGWQAQGLRELVHDQETDIALLHTQPAQYLARELPTDSIVMVEGAGATRYRAPRGMFVLDALGLNYAEVAHAPDDSAKACVLVRAQPTHALLPDHIAAPLSTVFELRPIERFEDPHYAIVQPPQVMAVTLFSVVGPTPRWAQRCRLAGPRDPG